MSSKAPYENIYIGNFIYSLGYLSGKKNEKSEDAGVHLIQQTPDDKKWADLLTRWKGKYFILEFKREEKGCKQELRKKYCKKNECTSKCEEHRSTYFSDIKLSNNATLKEIADKAHFIGFGEKVDEGRTITFLPYSTITFVDEFERDLLISLNDLCNSLICGNKGADVDEFSEYMSFLAACVKEDADGASGFIVNIDDNGNIHLVDLEDVNDVARDLALGDPKYSKPSKSNIYSQKF